MFLIKFEGEKAKKSVLWLVLISIIENAMLHSSDPGDSFDKEETSNSRIIFQIKILICYGSFYSFELSITIYYKNTHRSITDEVI